MQSIKRRVKQAVQRIESKKDTEIEINSLIRMALVKYVPKWINRRRLVLDSKRPFVTGTWLRQTGSFREVTCNKFIQIENVREVEFSIFNHCKIEELVLFKIEEIQAHDLRDIEISTLTIIEGTINTKTLCKILQIARIRHLVIGRSEIEDSTNIPINSIKFNQFRLKSIKLIRNKSNLTDYSSITDHLTNYHVEDSINLEESITGCLNSIRFKTAPKNIQNCLLYESVEISLQIGLSFIGCFTNATVLKITDSCINKVFLGQIPNKIRHLVLESVTVQSDGDFYALYSMFTTQLISLTLIKPRLPTGYLNMLKKAETGCKLITQPE